MKRTSATEQATRPAKAALRRRFRGQRRSLSRAEQRYAATAVAQHLDCCGALAQLKPGGSFLAAYAANTEGHGELSLEPLLNLAWQRKARTALPTVARTLTGRRLNWREVQPTSRLRRGAYDLAEPVPEAAAVHPLALSLLCVPLVAFDAQGNRLGQGGGYYDRFFARWRHPLRIGIAHECQRSAQPLPQDPWDQPLDAVVTPTGINAFSARGRRLRAL